MLTADLHSDTLLECLLQGCSLRENNCMIDALKLRRGEALLQCFAAFIPTHDAAERSGITDDGYTIYKKMAALLKQELKKNEDLLLPVLKAEDMDAACAAGKTGAMFTVEDMGAVLDGHAERLEEAYQDGVRLMSLTWNYINCLGYPNSTEAKIMEQGLTPFGIETIAHAEALGMALDVSHLSDGGFYDVARYAKKPFAASHSCCRALCPHPRNLTDEMLRILADKGGVVGINYYGSFLAPGEPKNVNEAMIADHLERMLSVGGEDLPALGSDYDGMDSVLSWKDASGTQAIVRELEARRISPRIIEKICYKNVRRFFGDTLTGR